MTDTFRQAADSENFPYEENTTPFIMADLARTLRAAHDEGNALIRDLIDATVSSISATPDLPGEHLREPG